MVYSSLARRDFPYAGDHIMECLTLKPMATLGYLFPAVGSTAQISILRV